MGKRNREERIGNREEGRRKGEAEGPEPACPELVEESKGEKGK